MNRGQVINLRASPIDQQMLADMQEIKKQLKLLQSQNVSKAENSLKELSSMGGLGFLTTLSEIITDPHSQEEYLKLTAASQFNSTVYDLIVELPQQSVGEIIMKILQNQAVSTMVKRVFERSIVTIIEVLPQSQLAKWEELATTMLGRFHINSLKYAGFLLVNCFATADLESQHFSRIIWKCYGRSVSAVLNSSKQKHQILWAAKQFAKTWSVVYDKLLQGPKQAMATGINLLCRYQQLYQLLEIVYQYQAGSQVYFSLNEEMACDLNPAKTDVAEYHLRLLEHACKKSQLDNMCLTHFFKIFPSIVKTTAAAAMNRQKMQQVYADDLIIQCLKMLSTFYQANQTPLQNEAWINFQQYICFKLLQADDAQRQDFQTDYDELNVVLQDCCDKQLMGRVKTQAARLLQCIADIHTQSIEYAVARAVESLKLKLNFIPQPNHLQNKTLEVETSFLLLAMFSYHFSKLENKKVLLDLKAILCDRRITELPPFQTARMFFSLAYCFQDLFTIDGNDIVEGKHLIEFAINYSKHKSVQTAGLDFLTNLIDSFYDQQIALNLCENKLVEFRFNIVIFTCVSRIIFSHYDKFSTQVWVKIINGIYRRIIFELDDKKGQSVKDTLFLQECLKLIILSLKKIHLMINRRNLESINPPSKTNSKCKANYEQVKQQIWKITQFLQESAEHQSASTLSYIIYEFLHFQKQITVENNPHYFQVLPQVLQNVQKDKFINADHFLLLNEYVMKTPLLNSMEDMHAEHLTLLLRMLIKGLSVRVADVHNKRLTRNFQKQPIIHLFFVLQNFVAMHGTGILKIQEQLRQQSASNDLKNNVLNDIVNLTQNLLPQDPEEQICDGIIFARALNLMFLCHMHSPNQRVLKALLLFHDRQIYASYDTKVLLQCLKKQITQEKQFVNIAQIINIMVRVAQQSKENALKAKVNYKSKKAKKMNTDLRIQLNKVKDYQQMLNRTSTPFQTNIDEQVFVRQTLGMMKETNPAMCAEILKQLTSDVRKKMGDLAGPKICLQNGMKRPLLKIVDAKASDTMEAEDIKTTAGKRSYYQVMDLLANPQGESSEEQVVGQSKGKVRRQKTQKQRHKE